MDALLTLLWGCRRLWISSKEHLNVNFNPASLLSFGDLLAFANSVLSVVPSMPSVGLTPTSSAASINTLVKQGKWTAPEAAPAMREQLAVEDEITSRVPQKYLIQNQSGMRVFYWAERVSLTALKGYAVALRKQWHGSRQQDFVGLAKSQTLPANKPREDAS